MDAPDLDFRERVLKRLTAVFGPARPLPLGDGTAFYRWILARSGNESIYLTLNSPELNDLAHIVVSDPRQKLEPVTSVTLRTMSELETAIGQLSRQWKNV